MAFPFQGIRKCLMRRPRWLRLYRWVILTVELHGKYPQAVLARPCELGFFIGKKQLAGAIWAVQRVVAVRVGFAPKPHDKSSSSARSTQSRNCSPGFRCSLKLVTTRTT